MSLRLLIFVFTVFLIACHHNVQENFTVQNNITKTENIAPKPLYRDPIFDGAADPNIIWNEQQQKWFMFYTNRRANIAGLNGVEWVHGTPIGIAESTDGGASWYYKQNANINAPPGSATYWAPEVIAANGEYYMFLTIVPGVFNNWDHPRSITLFTSKDLLNWDYISTLKLNSNRVIDADVIALPDGGYRLFYNDEPDGKSIYIADSSNLRDWVDQGKADMQSRGEGPVVFSWQGYWWMIVDAWAGLSVYRSNDLLAWQQQSNKLLEQPGRGQDDQVKGGHPDVIVSGEHAYLFYFTHPGRTPDAKGHDNYATRRSSIQVTELTIKDGWLDCDRNSDTPIKLTAP